jgi:hypothetical protein
MFFLKKDGFSLCIWRTLLTSKRVDGTYGYQVVFSLAEVDPAFTDRKIILANRKDGKLLPAEEGPFHIIIEGEKKRPRSARQVISLKVELAN